MRPASDKPVLAVLPFENRSADVDAYFADGLTEDIITNLSRFRDLLVIGRSASFRFRDAPPKLSIIDLPRPNPARAREAGADLSIC